METILRVTYVYILLMVLLRIIGKRELSKMSPFELVTLLLIPELFQQALIREDFSMTNATVALSTLLLLVFITSAVTFVSKKARKVVTGDPTVLVHAGRMLEHNLARERVTPEEIFTSMRHAGVLRLSEVKWAILEDDGKISVIPKHNVDPEGPEDPTD